MDGGRKDGRKNRLREEWKGGGMVVGRKEEQTKGSMEGCRDEGRREGRIELEEHGRMHAGMMVAGKDGGMVAGMNGWIHRRKVG